MALKRVKHKKQRHIPQRTCVGCRLVQPKKTLIRVVRTPQGVVVDETGRQTGRGAYVHNQRSCWQKALNGGIGHALKADLTEEDRYRLTAFADSLPE